jgi:HPt (histidine-containing phosphotransfer) domain-containing protein
MTSTRTYSEPKPQDVVRAEIVRCSGKQFDPRVAQVFLEMMDDDPDYLMSERGGASRVWKEKERLWDLAESETAEEAAAAAGTLAGTGTFSEAGDAAPEVQIPEALRNIEGLDPEKGIANCGSAEGFLSVLDVFAKTAGRKASEIQSYYDSSDTANYTIKVHALKSAARIIGADRLSEMARALEMAAKAGDIDTIRQNTGEMLSVFQKLDEDLRAAGQQEGSLKEMSASSRKEAFQTLLEIAQSLDYGMMDDLLKELKSYRLSGEDAETLREIEEKLLQLDWEGIREILEEKS